MSPNKLFLYLFRFKRNSLQHSFWCLFSVLDLPLHLASDRIQKVLRDGLIWWWRSISSWDLLTIRKYLTNVSLVLELVVPHVWSDSGSSSLPLWLLLGRLVLQTPSRRGAIRANLASLHSHCPVLSTVWFRMIEWLSNALLSSFINNKCARTHTDTCTHTYNHMTMDHHLTVAMTTFNTPSFQNTLQTF